MIVTTAKPRPGTAADVRAPIFLYDGDCAFCSSCARFVERHIIRTGRGARSARSGAPPGPNGEPRVAAWQFVDVSALGLTEEECDAAVQWVTLDGSGQQVRAAGPAAIAELLRAAGGLWRPLGSVLRTRLVLAVAWPVYRWVARHRHQMPGGTAACALPQAERDRLSAADQDARASDTKVG
jgi:predicted DCC family thiol-disulfide oxidoreductase YuxK